MDEFETVHDEEGFSYKRKRIPDDGRTLGRARVAGSTRSGCRTLACAGRSHHTMRPNI